MCYAVLSKDTWVMTAIMSQKLEGVHMGLLQQVTGNNTRRLGDDYWRKVAVDSVL